MNEQSHRIAELPILVLYPHSRCNCRCVMCDIWRIRQIRELTDADLEPHLASLRALKVKWIVFSGGEPLMHSDLPSLCRLVRRDGVRVSLLTAGLILERHAGAVAEWMDEVIVSLDGPPDIHDAIRGVPEAFRRLERGIHALRDLRPEMPIRGRCTVQKDNFGMLRDTVRTAHELNLNSISFLAADVGSEAFNRPEGWPAERQQLVALGDAEVDALDLEIESLIRDFRGDMDSGFIVEKADKLCRIPLHFRAHLGQTAAVSPRCNAPWVSAVVESDGTVRPCFFHRAIGNIHDRTLADVLNGNEGLEFRSQLNVTSDPICRNCVCSLFLEKSE
jgi:MoaA/NifB/PqqE/SkfB family radical SAM enzyme